MQTLNLVKMEVRTTMQKDANKLYLLLKKEGITAQPVKRDNKKLKQKSERDQSHHTSLR